MDQLTTIIIILGAGVAYAMIMVACLTMFWGRSDAESAIEKTESLIEKYSKGRE